MSAIKMDGWAAVAMGSAGAPRRDPMGLAAGWRGYRAFSRLNAMTDAELAAEGLTRADLPRLALAVLRREG